MLTQVVILSALASAAFAFADFGVGPGYAYADWGSGHGVNEIVASSYRNPWLAGHGIGLWHNGWNNGWNNGYGYNGYGNSGYGYNGLGYNSWNNGYGYNGYNGLNNGYGYNGWNGPYSYNHYNSLYGPHSVAADVAYDSYASTYGNGYGYPSRYGRWNNYAYSRY